ncbi:probable disease resistance protein At4g27220 [Pistacia vera]|uniref:probable disease resistance protein At4g27220 n=1 Tax=Pistacia vera TaxID=55513 RepID=UPI0012631307|nr:probable disease resistance protein At4g27220 [Pistacia vera]
MKIQLNVLNEREGFTLLKKHASIGDDHPALDDAAIGVSRECYGLPLALVAIGCAMKGKEINDWKVMSQKVKESKLEDILNVAGLKDIYACLRLSYDYLKDEKTKLCFFLCSLFPEDYIISLEQLVRYGVGLGLYQDADRIEDARNELLSTLNYLKPSCLLLDSGGEEFVKMHDMVCDVALWIASKRNNIFTSKSGMGLIEWSNEEGWKQYTAISSLASKIVELPTSLSLELIGCVHFKDISSLGRLIKLEILSLKDSIFDELPKELGELGKLRLLDLRACDVLKKIPSNVIQRLSQLEELYMGDSFKEYQEFKEVSEYGSNASFYGLSSLSRLALLSVEMEAKCLLVDFPLPKLLKTETEKRGGGCTVPAIPLPQYEGCFCFLAVHSCYTELHLSIKAPLMQSPKIESSYIPPYPDGKVLLFEGSTLLKHVGNLMELEHEMCKYGLHIKNQEMALKIVNDQTVEVEQVLFQLQGFD